MRVHVHTTRMACSTVLLPGSFPSVKKQSKRNGVTPQNAPAQGWTRAAPWLRRVDCRLQPQAQKSCQLAFPRVGISFKLRTINKAGLLGVHNFGRTRTPGQMKYTYAEFLVIAILLKAVNIKPPLQVSGTHYRNACSRFKTSPEVGVPPLLILRGSPLQTRPNRMGPPPCKELVAEPLVKTPVIHSRPTRILCFILVYNAPIKYEFGSYRIPVESIHSPFLRALDHGSSRADQQEAFTHHVHERKELHRVCLLTPGARAGTYTYIYMHIYTYVHADTLMYLCMHTHTSTYSDNAAICPFVHMYT